MMMTKQEIEEQSEMKKQLMMTIEQMKISHQTEVEHLQNVNRKLENLKESLEVKLNVSENQVCNLKKDLSVTRSELFNTKNELQDVTQQLESKTEDCNLKKRKIEQLELEIEDLKQNVKKLEAKEREHEMIRRKLHNSIQELKGNIRVFCRVRPLLGEETNNQKLEDYFEFPETNEKRDIKVYSGSSKTYDGKEKGPKKFEFTFDKVFSPTARQHHVFDELSQLVQSSLDGYNTCIFTYGQTGR